MPDRYLRYSDSVETPLPDEHEVIGRIINAMTRESGITFARHGRAIRSSHAKAHGLLKGELRVLGGLPPELAQGLFAAPRSYPALVRMANVPGELLDDSVGTQRGLSLKVLGVEGEMLSGAEREGAQDWVLDTGTRFANADAAAFLASILGLEQATRAPQAAKVAVSKAARAANAALHALGADSAMLDFLGHPPRHPLAEPYFTQAPIRYGEHVAKLGLFPILPTPGTLPDIDASRDPDALRTATTAWFRANPAGFEIRIQLCTDLGTMPVEDASAEWSQERSPYRPVARLMLPVQDAFSEARRAFMDEALVFCPAHALAAHRPLGSIMRARMQAYEAMATWRQTRNGVARRSPRSLAEVPD